MVKKSCTVICLLLLHIILCGNIHLMCKVETSKLPSTGDYKIWCYKLFWKRSLTDGLVELKFQNLSIDSNQSSQVVVRVKSTIIGDLLP